MLRKPFIDIDEIPYQKCENEYIKERGHFNYGIFTSTNYVNKKIAPLLNSLVTYFYGENETDKNNALETLKKFAEEYKQI